MKIYRILAMLLCIAIFLCSTTLAYAAEGNMDGDGGDMGAGEGGVNTWSPGYDGVRVSVVNKSTHKVSGNIFDWTTVTPATGIRSFTKNNKLQYLKGTSLTPNSNEYVFHPAPNGMPNIISSSGSSNIAAVKDYFTDEGRIRAIADDANLAYDTLINGDFVIMLEPVAYFTYNGTNYAMTATEAALYDRNQDGNLRAKMGYLTHQNLPLSMYLEYTELGIPPWSGGSGLASNENIISYLGVGTVRFDDLEEEPPPDEREEDTYDYEYFTDTYVVTSVWIDNGGGNITPDDDASATFHIPNQSSVTRYYVIPAGDSQRVWAKWKTPSEPGNMTITVTSTRGSVSKSTINIKLVKPEENTPPDPQGRDRNDTFKYKAPTKTNSITSRSWGEWWCWWQENWELESYEDSKGNTKWTWVDRGWWEYEWDSYYASLSATASTKPDDRVPTATGSYGNYIMKSAYGINAEVETVFTTNGGSADTAPVQYVIATFPEFGYKTYNRFLEGAISNSSSWQFKENEYSQVKARAHFTPIWYPDNTKFPVLFEVNNA